MQKGSSKYGEGLAKCTMCKKVLPKDKWHFYINVSKKDGLTTECIVCKKIYQLKRNKELRERRADFVRENGSKCNECGLYNSDTSFFDIDHIIPINITRQKRSLPSKYESNKLKVLCPNCHRTKTIKENNERKNK